ncbi:MAG: CCA tRNA nucleotidyltransferase [Lachnospiraceae bacterium]|nr:CCA tRNA nucleotidyltransferase [Lachnospiraceae bacterium]
MKIPKEAENIIRLLADNTHDAYVVGGCVRDTLIGRDPDDWDITTDAKPEEIKKIFHRTIDTGIEHGTVTVLMNGHSYEVTTYRVDGEYSDHRRPDSVSYTDNLIEDLKRRDFTINAMAYNHEKGLVDAFGGQEDLKKGIVRCVGTADERFTEDALRILRAIRFSAQLGFEIEANTLKAIGLHGKDLPAVSAERILVELNKTINSAHPENMRLIWEWGLDRYISEHFYLIKDASGLVPGYQGSWAALMRDNTPDEVRIVLKELKSDNDTLNRSIALVTEYKNPLPETAVEVRRILNRIGPELFNALMDMYESSGVSPEEIDRLMEIKSGIMIRGEAYTLKQLNITGNDLLSLGYKPGPQLGSVLEGLLEEVLEDPTLNSFDKLQKIASAM